MKKKIIEIEPKEDMILTPEIRNITEDMLGEYIAARNKFPAMHSYHEGSAIIKEEFDELWDEIKKKYSDAHQMREELIQIGAMCIAFINELIDK